MASQKIPSFILTTDGPSQPVPRFLVTEKGKWAGEVEVSSALRQLNPTLPRTRMLLANSGRYSNLLVVNKKNVTVKNPTGMITPTGISIINISWKKLRENLMTFVGTSVVLVARRSDGSGHAMEKVAELANLELKKAGLDKTSSQANSSTINIYHVDVGENNEIVDELGIKALPCFLIYLGRELAYAGTVGGRKVKISTQLSTKPQVLLVEPDFKLQIETEKTLKRNGCDVFLAMSPFEAAQRIAQLSQSQSSGSLNSLRQQSRSAVDVILLSDKIQSLDLANLARVVANKVAAKQIIVCVLVSLATPVVDLCSEDVASYASSTFSSVAQAVINRPIKPAAMNKLLSLRSPGEMTKGGGVSGLTPQSLIRKIKEVQENAGRKVGGLASTSYAVFSSSVAGGTTEASGGDNYVGLRISAEDVQINGKRLVK